MCHGALRKGSMLCGTLLNPKHHVQRPAETGMLALPRKARQRQFALQMITEYIAQPLNCMLCTLDFAGDLRITSGPCRCRAGRRCIICIGRAAVIITATMIRFCDQCQNIELVCGQPGIDRVFCHYRRRHGWFGRRHCASLSDYTPVWQRHGNRCCPPRVEVSGTVSVAVRRVWQRDSFLPARGPFARWLVP